MMSVTSACQIPVEEEEEVEEDDDDEIPWAGHNELLRAYPNKQGGVALLCMRRWLLFAKSNLILKSEI